MEFALGDLRQGVDEARELRCLVFTAFGVPFDLAMLKAKLYNDALAVPFGRMGLLHNSCSIKTSVPRPNFPVILFF